MVCLLNSSKTKQQRNSSRSIRDTTPASCPPYWRDTSPIPDEMLAVGTWSRGRHKVHGDYSSAGPGSKDWRKGAKGQLFLTDDWKSGDGAGWQLDDRVQCSSCVPVSPNARRAHKRASVFPCAHGGLFWLMSPPFVPTAFLLQQMSNVALRTSIIRVLKHWIQRFFFCLSWFYLKTLFHFWFSVIDNLS